jgi:hypothetical protein
MFFRVLSAMLTADAIDRHLRKQQPRDWYRQAQPSAEADIAPVSRQLLSARERFATPRNWNPQAPERPR